MAGFNRRFLFDPGNEVITQIEGTVIIDREPPASLTGQSNGTVGVVAEWEDGPFANPTEVTSATDLESIFGAFGFTYDGVPHNNPCARKRFADGTLVPEFWNGNGAVAVANKRFPRLVVTRVDTSVGSVDFTRQASQVGNANFEWDLEPGQSLAIDLGAGNVVATFTATAGTTNSAASTYPTNFVGGERIKLGVDVGTDQEIIKEVFFLAADQTQAQVIARLNAALGYTAFATVSATVISFTGRKRGTSGNVRVLEVDAIVTTETGLSVVTVAGGGNVADIDKVKFSELKAVVEAAVTGTKVERLPSQKIRIAAVSAPQLEVDGVSTAGLTFGFNLGDVNLAATGEAGTIPAGTRVRTVGGTEWVTMQTVKVTATSVGPYSVKVRPANDIGTTAGTGAGTVTVVPFGVELAAFGVVNPLPLTAALTEAGVDAQYLAAIDSTLNQNSVAREINIIVSARQSNAVRNRLKINAFDASGGGLRGRCAVIRPPLKTSRTIAKSTTTAPGVGATRDQRVWYAYPGASTFLPQIGRRGLAGGEGFTADGIIDTGFDVWLASLASQLPPEENPGQDTPFLSGIVGLELGNTDVQNLTMTDYIAFKAAGIAALQFDAGNFIVASGVTSVDPAISPSLVNIARRRMADFIQDTLAVRMKGFNKKLMTAARRAEAIGEIVGFLNSLRALSNPASQRIESFGVDGKSANTPEGLAAGIFRIKVAVRTLSSLDYIVLDTTIGNGVSVQEQAA